jgi:hypothetical protein
METSPDELNVPVRTEDGHNLIFKDAPSEWDVITLTRAIKDEFSIDGGHIAYKNGEKLSRAAPDEIIGDLAGVTYVGGSRRNSIQSYDGNHVWLFTEVFC